jgi:uncharacterized RDD family membrane protein YckC
MMKQNTFYFLDRNSHSIGPFSREDLLAHLEENHYTSDTLVWHNGMPDWVTLSSFDGSSFSQGIGASAAQIRSVSPTTPASTEAYSLSSPAPWRRWFARFVDITIFGNAVFLLTMIGTAMISPDALQVISIYTSNPLFDGAILLLVWCPFECLLLAKIGTTPGKRVFGLRVQNKDGSLLPFDRLLTRYMGMTVYGMGCGIYLVLLFTYILSYRRLMSTRTTRWDEAAESHVVATGWTTGRSLFGGFIVFSALLCFAMIKVYFNKGIS